MNRRALSALIVVSLALAACDSGKNNSSWSTAKAGDPIVPALPQPPTLTMGMDATATDATQAEVTGMVEGVSTSKGVGPVDHVDIAKLDATRAKTGAALFQTKCSACHKISERYIGPALQDVTKRRQPEWILNMILAPEKMIQQDPTAKALLAQFLAPMANQSLTRDEAESILAFFLQNDSGTAPAPAEGTAPAGTEPAKTVEGQ